MDVAYAGDETPEFLDVHHPDDDPHAGRITTAMLWDAKQVCPLRVGPG